MQVLHVVATPRGAGASHTLRVTHALLDALRLHDPGTTVQTLDLYEDELPAVAGDNIETKYALLGGQPVGPMHQPSWDRIESLIHQFVSADLVVMSVPMWNFHVPYALKFYIDAIVQPGYLFRYDESFVPHGMCQGKRLVFVTSRGADYSAGTPLHAYDLQEPYLRAIFGFCGCTDVHFVHAQPMDFGLEVREQALAAATQQALALVPVLVGEPDRVAAPTG